MTFEAFRNSLSDTVPPQNLSPLLLALWFAGSGNWEAAHDIAQDIHTAEGSLVHAYLHRIEGDRFNAGYWYRKANSAMPESSPEEEWDLLVRHLLEQLT